jgi:glycosyl hydrolase family 26
MKRTLRPLVVALVASLLIIPSYGSVASGATRKIALGASSIDDRSIDAVDAHINAVGGTPALWSVWSDWGGPDRDFPMAFMNELKSRDIVPMVFWQPSEPTSPGSSDCSKWSLDKILDGSHDAYIREWAAAAAQFGGRIILRFAHEMNGYWFIWGYGRCTNTPAKFRAAWRHVWNIFKGPGGEGATNVKFLWSIFGKTRLAKHYPGNTYVDYAGLTAFNWGPNGGPTSRPWVSMVQNFKVPMTALSRVTRKPVIAAELGAAYLPSCGACDKTAWLRQGYPAVYAKWKRLKAIVYFDINMIPVANQPNWRLDSPESTLDAYRNVVADPRFQGQIP